MSVLHILPMSCSWRKPLRRVVLHLVLPSCALFLLPAVGMAQEIDIGAMLGAQIRQAMDKALSRRIMLTPSLLEINPATKTATIEFSNPTKDTLGADVRVGIEPPEEPLKPAKGGAKQAGGLLAKEEDSTASTMDTIPATQSLAPWVKGLPTRIRLAPGEKKSVTLKFEIPANAKPGEYAAWIVTKADAPSTPIVTEGTSADGENIKLEHKGLSVRPTSGTKLKYRVTAAGQ